MHLRRQPLVGIASTAVVIVLALTFIAALDWPVFRDWVSFYLMCTIPFTFVVGAFWHGRHPRAITRLAQPWRGVALLGMALAVGLAVAGLLLMTAGRAVTPPTPMITQCVIISVPISFFLAVVFDGWPFTAISKPLIGGTALLVVAYTLAVLVFETLMNFAWLPGFPAELDPHGAFDSWTVLVVIVSAMAAAFLLMHLELWPLSRSATLTRQPLLGLIWTAASFTIAGIMVYVGLDVAGMPAPEYLTTVPVPFLFGSIVLLVILEGPRPIGIRQPGRGIVSALAAAVIGTLLAKVFAAVAEAVSGELHWGAPTFDGQIWLASALLAVTFPFLSFHKDFFGLWPIAENTSPVR